LAKQMLNLRSAFLFVEWSRWGSSDIDGKARGRMSGSERVKITEDVRKFAAEQGLAEAEALVKGLADKSAEFADKGSEVYAKV
jgi:hypothetical protein